MTRIAAGRLRVPTAQVTAPPTKAGRTTKATVQNSHRRHGFDACREARGVFPAWEAPAGDAGIAGCFRLVMARFYTLSITNHVRNKTNVRSSIGYRFYAIG